jgi:hypothetical protein
MTSIASRTIRMRFIFVGMNFSLIGFNIILSKLQNKKNTDSLKSRFTFINVKCIMIIEQSEVYNID